MRAATAVNKRGAQWGDSTCDGEKSWDLSQVKLVKIELRHRRGIPFETTVTERLAQSAEDLEGNQAKGSQKDMVAIQ